MRVRYHQLASYQPKLAVDVKPIDAWTLVHLLTGVGLGLVGVPGLLTLGANLFWEAAENWRRPHPLTAALPQWTPEVNTNILIDIVIGMGGWALGAALASRKA